MSSPPTRDRCRRSARAASAACGRPSTCRSRSRRPAPASRRGRSERHAVDGVDLAGHAARTRPCGSGSASSGPRPRAAAVTAARRGHAGPCTRSACQQATQWPGRCSSSGGMCGAALVAGVGAARREAAARRQVEQRRHHALDLVQPRPARRRCGPPSSRCGIEPSRPSRVGMARLLEQLGGRRPPRPCARHTSRRRGRRSRRPRPCRG